MNRPIFIYHFPVLYSFFMENKIQINYETIDLYSFKVVCWLICFIFRLCYLLNE